MPAKEHATERIIEAVLEAFAKQPLPEDSKLWNLPNVIITPRIAGMTSQKWPAVLPPIPRADIWITRRTGSVFVETIDKSLRLDGYSAEFALTKLRSWNNVQDNHAVVE